MLRYAEQSIAGRPLSCTIPFSAAKTQPNRSRKTRGSAKRKKMPGTFVQSIAKFAYSAQWEIDIHSAYQIFAMKALTAGILVMGLCLACGPASEQQPPTDEHSAVQEESRLETAVPLGSKERVLAEARAREEARKQAELEAERLAAEQRKKLESQQVEQRERENPGVYLQFESKYESTFDKGDDIRVTIYNYATVTEYHNIEVTLAFRKKGGKLLRSDSYKLKSRVPPADLRNESLKMQDPPYDWVPFVDEYELTLKEAKARKLLKKGA